MYNPEYHHKLRGVIWNALQGTDYERLHGERDAVAFTFSNPFPPGSIKQGDQRNVIVASPHDGLVNVLSDIFTVGDEFNIGEMPFEISGNTIINPDVGEPGESGTLETSTGVYVPLYRDRWGEHGIDPDIDVDRVGWTTEFPLGVFLRRIRENISRKHDIVYPDYLDGVTESTELFDEASYQKGYSVDIPVTSNGYEYTFVVTKWKFDYTVRNNDHRRWLNLLLDAGVGSRNSLGFGFVNKNIDNHD